MAVDGGASREEVVRDPEHMGGNAISHSRSAVSTAVSAARVARQNLEAVSL